MREASARSCSCSTVGAVDDASALVELAKIRSGCPALHSVFLPDDLWPYFEAWHQKADGVACHSSMLVEALRGGHLHRLTGAVHRYLILDGQLHPNARRQYVMDLRERWMLDPDPLGRHRKSRIFTGRLTELQFAEWLEGQDWTITALEALREGHDIEARNVSSPATAFEVKSTGTEDSDFEMILRSLANEPSGGSVPIHGGINYLLFRVYEAAKQLADFHGRRIAVAIIDDLTWWRFKLQLSKGWLDWANPQFVNYDAASETFLQGQEERYPALRTELPSVVGSIDAVWVIRRSSGYEHHLEYEIRTRPELRIHRNQTTQNSS